MKITVSHAEIVLNSCLGKKIQIGLSDIVRVQVMADYKNKLFKANSTRSPEIAHLRFLILEWNGSTATLDAFQDTNFEEAQRALSMGWQIECAVRKALEVPLVRVEVVQAAAEL